LLTSIADHDWGWIAWATPQREIAFPRGKVTGGCSAVNASVAIRGVPADVDEWAALGNDQWSFAKVLPFYRRLEHDTDFGGDVHSKGGPIWIERPKRSLRSWASYGFGGGVENKSIKEASVEQNSGIFHVHLIVRDIAPSIRLPACK
jgi:choline dehydrogenase-like flavoprotein